MVDAVIRHETKKKVNNGDGSSGPEEGRSISRVLYRSNRSPRGDVSSADAIYLGDLSPGRSSNLPVKCRDPELPRPGLASNHLHCLVLLPARFTRIAGCPTTGGLLPHHLTLTDETFSRIRRRYTFFALSVPRDNAPDPGDYPVPRSLEPGLSSAYRCGMPRRPDLPSSGPRRLV